MSTPFCTNKLRSPTYIAVTCQANCSPALWALYFSTDAVGAFWLRCSCLAVGAVRSIVTIRFRTCINVYRPHDVGFMLIVFIVSKGRNFQIWMGPFRQWQSVRQRLIQPWPHFRAARRGRIRAYVIFSRVIICAPSTCDDSKVAEQFKGGLDLRESSHIFESLEKLGRERQACNNDTGGHLRYRPKSIIPAVVCYISGLVELGSVGEPYYGAHARTNQS